MKGWTKSSPENKGWKLKIALVKRTCVFKFHIFGIIFWGAVCNHHHASTVLSGTGVFPTSLPKKPQHFLFQAAAAPFPSLQKPGSFSLPGASSVLSLSATSGTTFSGSAGTSGTSMGLATASVETSTSTGLGTEVSASGGGKRFLDVTSSKNRTWRAARVIYLYIYIYVYYLNIFLV